MDKDETRKHLQTFVDTIVSEAKKRIKPSNATGKAADSLTGEVIVTENAIEVTISGEPYVKFIDRGVKGVETGRSLSGYRYKRKGGKRGLKGMPPPSAFDKWNIIRGRSARDERGRFLSRKSLNFATAVTVFKHGIKPKRFLTDPFEEAFKQLPDELIISYGLDMEDFINQVMNDI